MKVDSSSSAGQIICNKISKVKMLAASAAFGIALLGASKAEATVTITKTDANISADTAAVTWTSLSPITIAENVNGDIAAGTNVTLVLLAPAGFIFNTAVTPSISFTAAKDITAASIAVSDASTLTITLTLGSAANKDTLVIGGTTAIQVQPTLGTPLATGNHIYRPTTGGGSAVITGVTASASGATGTSFGALTEVGGAATQLVFTTQPAGAVAGANFGTQPVVNAQDQFGNNTASGLPSTLNVTVTLTSGTGPLQGTVTKNIGTSSGNGTGTFTTLRLDVPGNNDQLTASTTNGLISGTSSIFSVTPGAASKLAMGTQPSATATAGAAFAQQPVIFIEDSVGNVVTNSSLTITAARSGGSGTLAGTLAVVAVNGVATFTDLSISTANNITIQFTKSGVTSVTSSTIAVAPGAFSQLQLLMPGETAAPGTATGKTGSPSTRAAGTAFSVIVNAVDTNWNVVNSITDSAQLSSSDANAVLPAATPLVAGTKTLSATFITPGTQTITASDATQGGILPNTSPSTTVTAPPASQLVMGTQPSATATAGVAFAQQPVVLVEDVFGNIVTNTPVTVVASRLAGSGTLQGTTSIASVNGVVTYTNLSQLVAGDMTIQFTKSGLTTATSSVVTVSPAAFTKLLVLAPGQAISPGSATGRAGTVTTQTAGTPFNVTVLAVDANWNPVTNVTDTVGITSTDTNAILPANVALVNGTTSLALTINNANEAGGTTGSQSVTASDASDGTKTSNTSSSIPVNPGAFVNMQLLMPGETAAPGTISGKTGTPTAQTVGVAFNAIVNAVDANWNVAIANRTVSLTSTDPNATGTTAGSTLGTDGTRTFSMTFKTVGNWTVTTTDSVAPNPSSTSPLIAANAGAFSKLLVVAPGESANPLGTNGKTGTPTAQTAGTPFNVTVNAVDANWYPISSINDTVGITSSDPNAILPANVALVSGTNSLTLTVKKSGSSTVSANDVTTSGKTGTSSSITVNPSAYTMLQVLMPGETAVPGTASGKTGTPTARTAGTSFNSIVINAVDAYWNIVTTVTNQVTLSSSDTNATFTGSPASLSSGTKTFNTTTFKAAGSQTVTATDSTDGSKLPNTGSPTTVSAGTYTKMQLLVPGETAAPGSTSGKTGVPATELQAAPFGVTVNAVDANWNLVSATDTIKILSSDAGATLPPNTPLVAGTKNLSVTLNTLGTFTITATNVTSGTKTSSTSPGITNTSSTQGQTITFGALTNKNYGDVPFSLSATASSGLPVSFSVLSGPASIVGSTVTITGAGNVTIQASQSGNGTYTAAPNVNQGFSILQAALTVAVDNQSRPYGATNPVFTGTINGIQYGDNISATYGTTATATTSIGTYSITPTMSDPNSKLGNYAVSTTNGTLTISAVPLSVVAGSFFRAYGATNPVFTGTITGLQNGDNITATYATSATTNSTVGSYSVIPTLVDPNNKQGNYSVSLTNGNLNVTVASLTVVADSFSRVYGATNPVFTGTITGLQNGDNITATYATSATTNSPTGSYAITPTLVDSGSKLGNYSTNLTNGTLTVTPATLTVVPDSFSRIYGATNPVFTGTITGLQNGDNITATYATTATTNSPIGGYQIIPTLVDAGNLATNYTTNLTNGTLTVNAAALIVTADNVGRAYGAINPALTGNVTGLQNGDSITATFSSSATTNSPVGTYPITPALVDVGGVLGNYTVTTNGVLIVTKATLSVTANNASKIFGMPNPVLTGTITGLQNGDNITAAYSTTVTTNSPVGNYPIMATLVDGGAFLANYNAITNNGILSINYLPMQWTAGAGGNGHYYQPILAPGGITWDAAQASAVAHGGYLASITSSNENQFIFNLITNSDFWVFQSGQSMGAWIGGVQPTNSTEPSGGWSWVNGDAFGYSNWASSEPDNAAPGNENNIQFYSPTLQVAGTWNDLSDTNTALVAAYVIEYSTSPGTNAQTIAFAALPEHTYGDAPFNLSATASSGLTVTFSIISGPAIVAGNTLTMTGAGTVTVRASQPGNGLFMAASNVNQSFAVDQAMLSVFSFDTNRVYGAADPVFTGELDGVIPGDGITTTFGSDADNASDIGGYTIYPILSDPNGKMGNYSVGYRTATLTITKASLSVVASNATRAYGAANPVFTGSLTGMRAGDGISINFTPAANAASPIGNYAITPSLVDPNGKLMDYTVSSTGATLTITPTPLLIQADNKTRPFGANNPALTGTFTGLKNGDPITATYFTTATNSSAVGTYPIVPTPVDTLNKLTNYSLTLSNGTLTVILPPPPVFQGIAAGLPSNLTVTWSAVSNIIYRVQYTLNPSSGSWTDLTPNVTATNSTASFTDHPAGDAHRFYRIKVVAP